MKKFCLLLLLVLGLTPIIAQEALPPVYPYAENGKWGAIDKEGEILVKPKYSSISLFLHADNAKALATVTNEEGLMGAIDRNGKIKAKIKYKFVDLKGKGDYLIVTNSDNLYGLVKTKNKKEILKTEYKSIRRFRGAKLGVSIIRKGDLYGAINENGKLIAKPIYKKAELKDAYKDYPDVKLTREDGSAFVMDCWGDPVKKTAGGRMDDDIMFEDQMIEEAPAPPPPPKSTTRKIEVDGQNALEFTTAYNGKATPEKDTLFGIDQVVKVFHRYKSGRGYCVDYVIAKKGDLTGIINYQNEILTPFEYNSIRQRAGRNYFELKKGEKKGAASGKGELIFDARFDTMKLHSNYTVFNVKIGNYEGYVDRTGHVYLPKKALN